MARRQGAQVLTKLYQDHIDGLKEEVLRLRAELSESRDEIKALEGKLETCKLAVSTWKESFIRMAKVVDSMRPVVSAAIGWHDSFTGVESFDKLEQAVETYSAIAKGTYETSTPT